MGGELDFMKSENWMRGLRLRDLKHSYGLAPLLGSIGVGVVFATWYGYKLCTHPPDVTWRHAANPQPYESTPMTYQYKLITFLDYKKMKHPEERPEL